MPLGIYAALPPEINLARLLSGGGAAPMIAAAAGFSAITQMANTLATATDVQMSGLLSTFFGDTADKVGPAFQRHTTWLREVGASAQVASTKAAMQATYYQGAVAGMPTPPEFAAVYAGRTAAAVAGPTGGASVALAASEALYTKLWVQAAGSMAGYDANSTQNTSTLTPTTQSPDITNNDMMSKVTQVFQQIMQAGQQIAEQVQNQQEEAQLAQSEADLSVMEGVVPGFLGAATTSAMLSELNGGGAIAAPITAVEGNLTAVAGMATGFHMPGNWSGVATAAPLGAAGGPPPSVGGGTAFGGTGGALAAGAPLAGMLGRNDARATHNHAYAPDHGDHAPALDSSLYTTLDYFDYGDIAQDADAEHEHDDRCVSCGRT